MFAAVHGFLIQMGLIVAIGAQNAFILKQGIKGEHVLAVCLICTASDAVMIPAGIAGVGALTAMAPWFGTVFRWIGAAFLIVYGGRSAFFALKGASTLTPSEAAAAPLGPTVAACLAFTWLNPHFYLDAVGLIGSLSAQYPGHRFAFGAGAIAASAVFFFSLGYGARLLRPVLARPQAWRMLDGGIAATMWMIAAGLVASA